MESILVGLMQRLQLRRDCVRRDCDLTVCRARLERDLRATVRLRLRWRFGVAVTRWSRSTQLLYIEPG